MVKMFEITCVMMTKAKPRKPNDPKKAESNPDGYFDLQRKHYWMIRRDSSTTCWSMTKIIL